MRLTKDDFALFQREVFTFKQLKLQHSPEELTEIKQEFKTGWEKWKALQALILAQLPETLQLQTKVESWTNGWNLRNHFWCAYRGKERQAENACLATLLNRKQFQTYLMFQHYKSAERTGSVQAFNRLLPQLTAWSAEVDLTGYYIWPQKESELLDHLPLEQYLADEKLQNEFAEALGAGSFQIGRLWFATDEVADIEQQAAKSLLALANLYELLAE